MTYISVYLREGSIHVYAEAIRFLGRPKYIRFLLNRDGSSMVMEAYHKKEFQSVRVPKETDASQRTRVFSTSFCRLLAYTLKWNAEKSYRIPGRYIASQHIIVFDLTKATAIGAETTE